MSLFRHRGYMETITPDGNREADTCTCQHCGKIVRIKPFCDPADIEFGGMCKVCGGFICAQCYGKNRCDPLERKLERAEASYHARRSYV